MPIRLLLAPFLVAALLAGAGCGDDAPPTRGVEAATLVVLAPRDGAIFPPDFTPATFLWEARDTACERYRVAVTFADGSVLERVIPATPPARALIDDRAVGETNSPYVPPNAARLRAWTPEPADWQAIQSRSRGSQATVRITALGPDASAGACGAVRIGTSTDPLVAPIFYRDVPLMPAVAKDRASSVRWPRTRCRIIEWRLRDVSRPASKVVLTDMPSCANCHSFSRDGKTLAMDVDGPTGDKGAYAIAPIREHMVISTDQMHHLERLPGQARGAQDDRVPVPRLARTGSSC